MHKLRNRRILFTIHVTTDESTFCGMPETVLPQNCVFEYAAKVFCGSIAKEPVPPPIPPCVPGYYATAINIHNPYPKETALWVKFAHAPQATDYSNPNIGGGISPWFKYNLKPDQAMELDADFLLFAAKAGNIILSSFAKGFLVIQAPVRLDVVSVHSAGPIEVVAGSRTANMGYVATVHTERVPEHKIGG